jgi:hypothetical protein
MCASYLPAEEHLDIGEVHLTLCGHGDDIASKWLGAENLWCDGDGLG